MSAGAMDSVGELVRTHESQQKQSQYQTASQSEVQSATDTDMEEEIKNSGLDHQSRKVLHKGFRAWEDKLATKLKAEPQPDTAEKPNSQQKKKR